jgi:CO/xanthine dehydrogenase Mo-binding subunit
VDLDKIVVKHDDTMAIPMGNGTGGSRSVAVVNAVVDAPERRRPADREPARGRRATGGGAGGAIEAPASG